MRSSIKVQTRQLRSLVKDAQSELRVLATRLIAPHAAAMQQQLTAGIAAMQREAAGAIQNFHADVS